VCTVRPFAVAVKRAKNHVWARCSALGPVPTVAGRAGGAGAGDPCGGGQERERERGGGERPRVG